MIFYEEKIYVYIKLNYVFSKILGRNKFKIFMFRCLFKYKFCEYCVKYVYSWKSYVNIESFWEDIKWKGNFKVIKYEGNI